MKRLVVVATENEKKLICAPNIIVTGVGALNVISALKDVDRLTPIYNFGYAGSNVLPVKTRVNVGSVRLYHPNVEYDEPCYDLDGDVPCFTSNDFVTKTDIKEPCVFDMELAFILALGFKNVVSVKIVSDNLCLEEYERCLEKQMIK